MDLDELAFRKQIARALIDGPEETAPEHVLTRMMAAAPLPPCAGPIIRRPSILPRSVNWSANDPRPVEAPMVPPPAPDAPLPRADWVVVTWTREEHQALARVFTPTEPPGDETYFEKWYPYKRKFDEYVPDLRTRPCDFHPAICTQRLGRYYLVTVGNQTVLLFKSELHLNQDGPRAYRQGRPLPIERMTQQILEEVQPKYFISTGTAGGTVLDHNLGDTVVSTSGLFHCNDPQDFRLASFNCKRFGMKYWVSDKLFARAMELMSTVQEHPVGMPHPKYPQTPAVNLPAVRPRIHAYPDLPILTTDFFEFGNSINGLGKLGCAVEMDDALLAKAIEEYAGPKPQYAFVRNVSDPVINGELNHTLQVMWAVYYYQTFGLLTTFNSSLVVWAIIAAQLQ